DAGETDRGDRPQPPRAPVVIGIGRAYNGGSTDAGWSSLVARRAHNPKVAGSNPAPATTKKPLQRKGFLLTPRSRDLGVLLRGPVGMAVSNRCQTSRWRARAIMGPCLSLVLLSVLRSPAPSLGSSGAEMVLHTRCSPPFSWKRASTMRIPVARSTSRREFRGCSLRLVSVRLRLSA